MFRLLLIILDQVGGLGITRASIVSAVADRTGDDSADAVVKIKRLINEKGPDFCMLTNWPFLRSDISFSIDTSAYKYSGASYLPATFKKVVGAYLLDGTDRYHLEEASIKDSYEWENPDDNDGRPDKFCITRMESGYWEIQFNRTPDNTYTVYMDIELQWSDLTADASETVITKDFYGVFSHYVSMARSTQQGDTELYTTLKDEWDNPVNVKSGLFYRALASISSPLKRKQVVVDKRYILPHGYSKNDYS